MAQQKIVNTKGAATKMGCTENWIHKLVSRGELKAYVYDENGNLAEREPHAPRQGQGLYFYEKDLNAYQGKKRGRPKGSKTNIRQKVKTAENSSISS